MIDVINYKPEHIEKIVKREVFKHDDNMGKTINTLLELNQAVVKTIVSGEDIVAIVGLTYIHKGVVEVWSVTSDLVKKYGISYFRAVLTLLRMAQDKLGIHRFQMTMRQDFEVGFKWAESLGFFRESVMWKYGPDKSNVYMYVRFV